LSGEWIGREVNVRVAGVEENECERCRRECAVWRRWSGYGVWGRVRKGQDSWRGGIVRWREWRRMRDEVEEWSAGERCE
jgi:hypothetical protein